MWSAKINQTMDVCLSGVFVFAPTHLSFVAWLHQCITSEYRHLALYFIFELGHSIPDKIAYAPSEDSDCVDVQADLSMLGTHGIT